MVSNTGHSQRVRRRVFQESGGFTTSLAVCDVTAEDVGTAASDMEAVYSSTRFITGISAALGGSGNPSKPIARGVFRRMKAAVHHLDLADSNVRAWRRPCLV